MRILVCDDEKARHDDVLAHLEHSGDANIEVVSLISEDLTTALGQLFDRVKTCLANPDSFSPGDDLVFDTVDLAIFDNNLSHLDIKGTRLTGESVVGYVRCFSKVPYVVSLNKNSDVDFDLRFLVGDYETKADLALNTDHLANAGLWSGSADDSEGAFRPWYWPALSTESARRREQIAFVRDRLNQPVLAALGFPTDEESLGFLSRHAKGALSPEATANDGDDGKPIADITFRDVFMAGSRSLPAKEDERKKLDAGSNSGNREIDELMARVVAADIDRWFRRDVLGPQEMLVDIPHLLIRMPFLLGKRAKEIAEWNAGLAVPEAPFGLEADLFQQHVASAGFAHRMWVPTPAFWWPVLKRNDQLGELFFAETEPGWADAVFCEDTSVFAERSANGGAVEPVEFTAEFEGSWARRHIAKLAGLQYAPRSRFAV